jgi:hypothetical protein
VTKDPELSGRQLLDTRQLFETFKKSEELNLALGQRDHPRMSAILSHNPAEWPESPPLEFLHFMNGLLMLARMNHLGFLKNCQQFTGVGVVTVNDSLEKKLIATTAYEPFVQPS